MSSEREWFGQVCGVATTRSELDECARVIEHVRVQELRRGVEGSAQESHAFAGRDVDSSVLYVRSEDGSQIIGCLRVTPATELAAIEESRNEYRIDVLPADHLAHYLVLTRLVILPEHRGSLTSLSLTTEMLAFGLEQGFAGGLMTCEPGLLGLYLALGAKPLGTARRSPTGGFRIPMICIADADHLESAGSPLAEPVRTMPGWQRATPLLDWYVRHEAEVGVIETGVRAYDSGGDDDAHAALTRGMSADGIEAMLRNAQVISCDEGDRIVASDDGSAFVGIVLNGAVEIRKDDRLLAMLAGGEVFGELAFVRDAPRSADVIALSGETEVVLLSRTAIDKITDPLDQVAVWRNLARCVGDRLAMKTSSD